MSINPQRVRTDSQGAAFDGDGIAQVSFAPVEQDRAWLVWRVAVTTDSAATTEARVYIDRADVDRFVDGTSAGNLDVADMAAPIVVPGGGRLVVEWTNGTEAAQATANLQYEDVLVGEVA